jgi:DNA-binding protein
MPRRKKETEVSQPPSKPLSKDTPSDIKEEPQVKSIRNSLSNQIFVGKKPLMSYAMSALIQLAQGGEVIIRARGMLISYAVDIAEIVAKRLGNNAYEVKKVAIDTERLGVGEMARNVSTIAIRIGRR